MVINHNIVDIRENKRDVDLKLLIIDFDTSKNCDLFQSFVNS